jgi:hypothetical protein
MPIGTAFHDRTFAPGESLNYREWSGSIKAADWAGAVECE